MIFRLLLALIFLYAGIDKVLNPLLFKATLVSYFSFPDILAFVLAIIFPWVEIIAALSLLFNRKTVYSSGFLFLLSMFLLALLILEYNHVLPYGCGCFDFEGSEKISLYHIVRDLMISAMAGAVFAAAYRDNKANRVSSHSRRGAGNS